MATPHQHAVPFDRWTHHALIRHLLDDGDHTFGSETSAPLTRFNASAAPTDWLKERHQEDHR